MKEEIVKKLAKEESEYLADWEDKEMYQKGFIDGYNKAKEMEKERLEDAYRTGIWDVGCRSISFEEYYNRTFKQQQEQ
jgi:hypothetical protein